MTLIWIVRAALVLNVLLLIAWPFLQGVRTSSDAAGNAMAQGYAAIGAVIGLVLLGVLALLWRWVTAQWAMIIVGGLNALLTLFLVVGTLV